MAAVKLSRTFALPQPALVYLCVSLFCMPCLLTLTASPAQAQAKKVMSETQWGLVTTTFQTSRGSIQVNLPDDLAVGDTISGTILIDPKGQSQKDVDASTNELNSHTVTVENGGVESITSVNEGDFFLTLPKNAQSLRLTLKDHHGHAMASQDVPIGTRSAGPAGSQFVGPVCGEAGRPMAMTGPCDGTLGSSRMRIAGNEVTKLAKSPRKLVVLCPPDLAGPAEAIWTEKGKEMHWHFNSVQLTFDAQSKAVTTGQNLDIKLMVRGAEGLAQPVYVTVENKTPDVVQLGGGDKLGLKVTGDIDYTLCVQGLRHGVFGLTACIR